MSCREKCFQFNYFLLLSQNSLLLLFDDSFQFQSVFILIQFKIDQINFLGTLASLLELQLDIIVSLGVLFWLIHFTYNFN
jgi:hypothetical protein